MFFNKNVRLAYAGAELSEKSDSSDSRRGFTMFDSGNGETDDFNAFGSSSGSDGSKQKAKKPHREKRTEKDGIEINGKSLIIAVSALVAVILLIVLIVAVANSGSKNIKFEDNTFIAYADSSGTYHVAMNGVVLGKNFENEVQLIEAGDRSFAYVAEDTEEGTNVYILKDKKLSSPIIDGATKILAYAEFAPGVVYNDDGSIYYYTDGGSDRITKDGSSTDNFVISNDATTVAYTAISEDDASEFGLYIFVDGISDKYAKNLVPLKIAQKGKYIYAYGISSADNITKKLYLVTENDKTQIDIEGELSFDGISYINVKGDEIIFSATNLESGVSSFVYTIKEGKATKISGNGVCVPVISDKKIACLSTLKKSLVEVSNSLAEGLVSQWTYYLDKSYNPISIAKYKGVLEPDGKYFYYINKDNDLYRVDVTSEAGDSLQIDEDIISFEITAKGNIYYLNDDGRLTFQKRLSTKGQKIADDVVEITMYDYSNTLYFEIEDGTKAYCSKEGSTKDIVTFSSTQVSSIPAFEASFSKKTFAVFKDADSESYKIFYTSNGKSFKSIYTDAYFD